MIRTIGSSSSVRQFLRASRLEQSPHGGDDKIASVNSVDVDETRIQVPDANRRQWTLLRCSLLSYGQRWPISFSHFRQKHAEQFTFDILSHIFHCTS
jgi:hypothetical protein